MILDSMQEIGCHWCVVVVYREKIIFFDSNGESLHESHFHIFRFLRKQEEPIKTSTFQIQPPSSNLCGLYALTFLDFMSKGYSLSKFLYAFEKNKQKNKKNDKIVKRLFRKSFFLIFIQLLQLIR